MKKSFYMAVACLLFGLAIHQHAHAQSTSDSRYRYKSAIGIKVFPFSVTGKFFTGRNNRAIEAIADFNNGFRLTALYEFHGDLTSEGNLKWYLGLGAHGGYYEKNDDDGVSAGLDGVIGLDYKFKNLPLNIAVDWQPAFELITPKTAFQADRGGIAVRFAF